MKGEGGEGGVERRGRYLLHAGKRKKKQVRAETATKMEK